MGEGNPEYKMLIIRTHCSNAEPSLVHTAKHVIRFLSFLPHWVPTRVPGSGPYKILAQ